MSRPYPIDDVSCKYGAPMGRRSEPLGNVQGKVHLNHVAINSGGYDAGGAYWGSGQPLYVCWGWDDEEYLVEHYIRANSRDDAKSQLAEEWDGLKFYR